MGDAVVDTPEAPQRRWIAGALEVAVAFGAMALMLRLSTGIWAVATERTAQVSALAALQLRLLLIAVPALVAMVIAARVRDGKHFALAARLGCAALAGVATGFVGGGLVVALKATPWCLNGPHGDSEQLAIWANAIQRGYAPEYPPAFYPPLFPYALSGYMQWTDQPAFYALKDLQILFTALVGPVAYLAWRLLLRPGWALGIGVVAALAVLEPYKPYGAIVLVTFLPLTIKFLQILRRADQRHWFQLAQLGVVFGVVFGVLVLLYSGWHRWAAPGIVVAGLVVFPWRRGRRNGLVFGGAATLLFAIVCFSYLTEARAVAQRRADAGMAAIVDDYVFFDVYSDPAYIAMWKGDLPGATSPQLWPPPGELGGVGVFTVLVIAGMGTAIAFGYRRTVVITSSLVLLAVWAQRMWTAHYLFTTKNVGLYPRTSYALLYVLVVLTGFALQFIVEAIARRSPQGPLRAPPAMIGAYAALVLLLGSMASSVADKYMPSDSFPYGPGWLAWQAHQAKKDSVDPEAWTTPAPPAPSPAVPPSP